MKLWVVENNRTRALVYQTHEVVGFSNQVCAAWEYEDEGEPDDM